MSQQSDLLNRVLEDVELTYQNLDSVELGITTVDPVSYTHLPLPPSDLV